MILIPILALFVGILLGFLVAQPLGGALGNYAAVAVLAGLDSICGGVRSSLERKFDTPIFVSGFFSNVVIAFFLAWLGDRIGINLVLAAALVLGGRIFVNLSVIRRYLITRWQESRDRRKLREAQEQQSLQHQQQQQVKT